MMNTDKSCCLSLRSLPFGTIALLALVLPAQRSAADEAERAKVRVTFGHRAPVATAFPVRFLAGAGSIEIKALVGVDLEENDSVAQADSFMSGRAMWMEWRPSYPGESQLEQSGSCIRSGNIFSHIRTPARSSECDRIQPLSPIRPRSRCKQISTARAVSRSDCGNSSDRAMWLPERDAFVTLGDEPVDFVKHLASLQGQRVLDRVKQEPEATRSRFLGLWQDVGDPRAWNVPWQSSWLGTTGHIVCVAPAHGSLSKFGIDRWGEVRPDLASEQKFRFDIAWPGRTWAGQRITNGLPVLVTKLEKGGQVSELEQLAVPLAGRRGGEMTIVAFCSHVSH